MNQQELHDYLSDIAVELLTTIPTVDSIARTLLRVYARGRFDGVKMAEEALYRILIDA